MIHHMRYGVVLRDDNLDGTSRAFDCLSGVNGTGAFETVERLIEPGARIAAVTGSATSFGQRVIVYEVRENGPLNLVDDQPVAGDFIVSTCSPDDIVFQSGMFDLVIDEDANDDGVPVVSVSIGLLLTLFPLLAQDWMAQVPAMLGEALATLNVPAQIEAALNAAGVGGGGVRRVAYTVFPTPENLAGTSLTVAIPDGVSGGMAERTVAPGDIVACITGFRDDVPYGAVVELRVVTALPASDGENSEAPTPWPLADRQVVEGDLFIMTGANQPTDNIGLIVVAPHDGVVMAAQANVVTRMFNELSAAIGGGGSTPAGPLVATPMESLDWNGQDRFVISADTTNQHIDVFMPDANDQSIQGHELTVIHRNDGGTGNNVAIAVDDNPENNILVPVGHVAIVRVAAQQFVLVSWL